MRLGLFGARADNTGLGMQTLEFYNHMKPDRTMVINISMVEQNPNRKMHQYLERYPDAEVIHGFPNSNDCRSFLEGLDVVFVAESPYNYDLYAIAREMGVKVAVQYNYEFFDWFTYPHYPLPDMFIAPSKWHYDEIDNFCAVNGVVHKYLHCPVDRDKIKFRNISEAKNFVHIAGRPAAHDRNGTMTFLEATNLLPPLADTRFTLYSQDPELTDLVKSEYPKVAVKDSPEKYQDLYRRGDVLVLPRRYGGNCLPMNEALSAGMPVIMSNIDPNNQFLPKEWLVHADKIGEFQPRTVIDIYECRANQLLLKMLWFSSMSETEMEMNNEIANAIAHKISWATMKPKYIEAFEELCSNQ